MKVVKFYSGERTSIADQIFAACDTPRAVQGDTSSILVAGAASRILRGFTASFENSTVSVSTGAALLAFAPSDTIQKGLYVGDEAPAQSLDCSSLPEGDYGVWVTFNSVATDLEERTRYQSGSTGFDQDINVFTRQSARWRLGVAPTSPGDEWLQIARLSLPAGSIKDTRPLLFEGSAADDFAPAWGSDEDRSAERGLNPISDIETIIAALKVAIEDVKGARWYEKTAGSGSPGGGGTGGSGPSGGGISSPDGASYSYDSATGSFAWLGSQNEQFATLSQGGLVLHQGVLTFPDGTTMATAASGTGTGPDTLPADGSANSITIEPAPDGSTSGLFVRNAAGTVVFSANTDGDTTMLGNLNVGRLATFQSINAANLNTNAIVATGNTSLQGTLNVLGASTLGDLTAKSATFGSFKATSSDLGAATGSSLTLGGALIAGTIEGRTGTFDCLLAQALEVGTAAKSGSAKIRGSLSVSEGSTLAGVIADSLLTETLAVVGAADFDENLSVAGSVTAAALSVVVPEQGAADKPLLVARADGTELVSADREGNFHILGTLVVAGAQTNDATNAGALTASSFVNSGNTKLAGTLAVEGETTLAGVSGQAASFTTLAASGLSTLADLHAQATEVTSLLVGGDAALSGKLTVQGASLLKSLAADDATLASLVCSGPGSFQALTVSGASQLGDLRASSILAAGDLEARGSLLIVGKAQLMGDAVIDGAISGKTLALTPGMPAESDVVVSVITDDDTSLLALDGEGNLVIRGGLKVNGGDQSDSVTNAGALTATSFNDSGVANIQGDTTLGSQLSVAGLSTLADLNAQAVTATSLDVANALNAGGPATLRGGLVVSGNTQTGSLNAIGITVSRDKFNTGGDLRVAGETFLGETHTGLLTASSLETSGRILANGTLEAAVDAVVRGNLSVAGQSFLHALTATDVSAATLVSSGQATVGADLSVLGAIKGVSVSLLLPSTNPPALPILLKDAAGKTLFSTDSQGNVVVAGTLTLTGNETGSANNLGAVTVTSFSDLGNASIQGTLNAVGATTLGQLTAGATTLGQTSTGALTATTLQASGNATLQAALSVAGVSTLAAVNAQALSAASVQIIGAASVGTTLRVTGATTLEQATTAALLADSLTVTKNASVGGTFTVAGSTTLASLGLSGVATFGSTLSVSGATTLSSLAVSLPATAASTTPVTVSKNDGSLLLSLDDAGNLTLAGKITATGGVVNPSQGDITVTSLLDTGDATIQGTLSVAGQTSLAGLSLASLVASGSAQAAALSLVLPSAGAAPTPLLLSNSAGSKLFQVSSVGNVLIAGTLGVTGATSASTLSTSGLASLNSLAVATTASVGSTLGVSGVATVGSLVSNATISAAGSTTSSAFRATSAGSASAPLLAYQRVLTDGNIQFSGVYSDGQFGQWFETVSGYLARSITYANGSPRDFGVGFVTHNAFTGVSGDRPAHRWYVGSPSALAFQIFGSGAASFASTVSVAGALTAAGLALSSGALTFPDGSSFTSAKVQSQPSYISSAAGTAALPAFQFAGGAAPSGIYFDSTPGNVLVSVNGFKSLFSTAAAGAAAGANGWAIASTLGSGSNLFAVFGSGLTSSPVFSVDGAGAVSATGLVKAGGVTLTSGSLRFPDGSTMTTAASGTGGGSSLTVKRYGMGPPSSTYPAQQNDGDDYTDLQQSMYYGPRVNGIWSTPPVSIIGPTGPAGVATRSVVKMGCYWLTTSTANTQYVLQDTVVSGTTNGLTPASYGAIRGGSITGWSLNQAGPATGQFTLYIYKNGVTFITVPNFGSGVKQFSDQFPLNQYSIAKGDAITMGISTSGSGNLQVTAHIEITNP